MPPRTATTPALYAGLTLFYVALAMVPTAWTPLDLMAAGVFTGPTPALSSATWWWVVLINGYVPAVFRVFLGVAFVGWLVATLGRRFRQWRMGLAFVVVAGILGPGAVVNLVFKDQWQRARPYQVENFGGTQKFTRAAVLSKECDNNCSFVSGHVACGVFFISMGLVHRRRRVAWAITGSIAGLVIGFARMSAVDHWLSDVLWAFPITLATSWLVWKALCRIYANPSRTVG